jgi:cobalt-zinc-cadmium efflux system outer membrane protein
MPAPVVAEMQTLSLPQAIEYSLQNNGDLKSFREEKGIRDAGKVKAGLLPNPALEFEGGTGALTGSSAENNLSFGVSQEFLLAGKREKRLAAAERELEMYRRQLADRERVLRGEVKSAFYDLILAQKRLALSESFISLNRQLFAVTKERLTAGDIPELELNLVKVELARSMGKKIEIENSLKQNQAKLWTLMGLPPGEHPAITGNLETEVSLTESLADLKRLARGSRPDLKALEAERSTGESEIILAQAEGIPNLTAGLAVKYDATSMEVGGMEGKDRAYTIGLKLSMPIPLFDRNQAAVQEARARRNSAESRLSAVEAAVEREVETAYAGFVNTGSILALYRTDILPQLEENLKLTQEAYRLGEVGILTVIEEQKKFFEVSDGYLAALHDRQAALVKLETAAATDITGGVQ